MFMSIRNFFSYKRAVVRDYEWNMDLLEILQKEENSSWGEIGDFTLSKFLKLF